MVIVPSQTCRAHSCLCSASAPPLASFLHCQTSPKIVLTPCHRFITSHSSLLTPSHLASPHRSTETAPTKVTDDLSVAKSKGHFFQFSSYLQSTPLTTLSFLKDSLCLWLPFLFLLCAPALGCLTLTSRDSWRREPWPVALPRATLFG